MRSSFSKITLLVLAIVFSGCASATVTHETRNAPVTSQPPTKVIVYPFATNPAEVTLNQSIFQTAYRDISGENVTQAQAKVADDAALTICWKVVSTLKQRGIGATCQQRGGQPGIGNLMVIDGEFTSVQEGDSASRLVVGFGVGAAVLNANVRVYQVPGNSEKQQLLSFKAHADSGALPGVAVSGPIGLLGGDIASSQTLTDQLGDKIAHEIVQAVFQYYLSQGWNAGNS